MIRGPAVQLSLLAVVNLTACSTAPPHEFTGQMLSVPESGPVAASGGTARTSPPLLESSDTQAFEPAFLRASTLTATNRICIYDRMGDAVAIRIAATGMCPLRLPW